MQTKATTTITQVNDRIEINELDTTHSILMSPLIDPLAAAQHITSMATRGWKLFATHVVHDTDADVLVSVWEYVGAENTLYKLPQLSTYNKRWR